jgi:hypothetical protein
VIPRLDRELDPNRSSTSTREMTDLAKPVLGEAASLGSTVFKTVEEGTEFYDL